MIQGNSQVNSALEVSLKFSEKEFSGYSMAGRLQVGGAVAI